MSFFLSPIGNAQQFDANGDPLVGGKLYTYLAGTSTPAATYTSSAGTTQHANPITLNALGLPDNGAPIWLQGGVAYKIMVKDSSLVSVGPPWDNVAGINDSSAIPSEWVDSGLVPTYVSATSFSVPGDQTSALLVGRRLKTVNTAGTAYSRISASSYAAGPAITTVTVVNDSTTLDSGLSAVSYGLLAPSNSSLPNSDAARTALGVPLRGFLAGLTLSTAGSSATFSVAAGEAADSTNTALLTLSAAISKTTAAWAVGSASGGLDTGAIANNTWYHAHLIRRLDTGVVDVLVSLSATAPTLPANYTKSRRIGSLRTNGSAQWTAFVQNGDQFEWLTPVADVSAANPGTAAVTRTLTVPTGVSVSAELRVNTANLGTVGVSYTAITNLATSDVAPTSGASESPGAYNGAAGVSNASVRLSGVRTNTSAQVRSRLSYSDAGVTLAINTLGWFDRRGRDE